MYGALVKMDDRLDESLWVKTRGEASDSGIVVGVCGGRPHVLGG